jgi:hypothetical protein
MSAASSKKENTPKPDFRFSFFLTKLEAKGEPACRRAYAVALAVVIVLGLPVGIGLCWRIATADLSIIQSAVGKAFSGTSVKAVSRD